MKVTILGCGTSTGVPITGTSRQAWKALAEKDRRLRSSILVEYDDVKLLVDTTPDLRWQCISNNVTEVTDILYTHSHADHLHGIDDVRGLNIVSRRIIDCHAHGSVFEDIIPRFRYAFERTDTLNYARPMLNARPFNGPFTIGGLTIQPFRQKHASMDSWGFRFGDFAYSTDVVEMSEEAFSILEGVKVWVVDALRFKPHPSHAHLERTLSWINRVKPEEAYLTHMNHEMVYETLINMLPKHVRPAFDGQSITI